MSLGSSNHKKRTLYEALFCVGIVAASATLYLHPPAIVRFEREHIVLRLAPHSVEMTGAYWYHNPWPIPVTQSLACPFPIDPDHPTPLDCTIYQVDPENPETLTAVIPAKHSPDKAIFDLPVPARGISAIRVVYLQECRDPSAVYLLTTTGPWGKPIEEARFEVNCEGVELVSSNYPLQARETAGKNDRFFFEKKQFFPTENWRLEWVMKESLKTTQEQVAKGEGMDRE